MGWRRRVGKRRQSTGQPRLGLVTGVIYRSEGLGEWGMEGYRQEEQGVEEAFQKAPPQCHLRPAALKHHMMR